MSSSVTSRSSDGRGHAARLVALPGIGFALCAFAFRDLLRIDPRLFDAEGLFEWSTWPRGLWFPLVVAGAANIGYRIVLETRFLRRNPVSSAVPAIGYPR